MIRLNDRLDHVARYLGLDRYLNKGHARDADGLGEGRLRYERGREKAGVSNEDGQLNVK